MARQIVHDVDVAGTQFGHEDLRYVGFEPVPLIGPSSTMGATMPVMRKPATSAVVLRYGAAAGSPLSWWYQPWDGLLIRGWSSATKPSHQEAIPANMLTPPA
ncbi:hypothetical protein GCM10011614_34960 [Novosphingobium colocasiae]|uniref:Uncharacterized protein n=1 Tax=Novosphingobium colocasiae TaxID=1256513 RepID=A0A918UKY2_9SPHN|nr:hypothetical protein GCM10011614_34960 [Novosphingobium colocasiae]